MDYTKNYNLKKPSNEDFYNVEDFNSNVETVDTELKKVNDKADKIEKQQINKIELEEILSSQNILKKIKEVDGAGSGLDADTVDGLNTGYHPNNTFIPNVYGSVLEIGKYIDFHEPGSNKDFDGRLSLNNKYPYWQPDSGAVSRVALADGTLQTNLNADLLNGKNSTDFLNTPNGMSIIRAYQDLNNEKLSGEYYHNSPTNSPEGTGNGYLKVMTVDSKHCTQIYIDYNDSTKTYIRNLINGNWDKWAKFGGEKMFTVPRKFEVLNPVAGQTVFSYSGGAGEVVTTHFQGVGGQGYNGHHLLVIDGVELDYSLYPSPYNSTLREIRIDFKNSIAIKMSPTSYNVIKIQGFVMTEK